MTSVDTRKRPRSPAAAQFGDSDEPIAREALDSLSNSAEASEGDVELETWEVQWLRCLSILAMPKVSSKDKPAGPLQVTRDLLNGCSESNIEKAATTTVEAVMAGTVEPESAARFVRRLAPLLDTVDFVDALQRRCDANLALLAQAQDVPLTETEEESYFQLCRLLGCLARGHGLVLSEDAPSMALILSLIHISEPTRPY